ncbi:hypothetical protein Tco_0837985 [Tanacetum coccineum]
MKKFMLLRLDVSNAKDHYTKDFLQKEEGNALEEAYYTQFGGPFQGGGYRATAPRVRVIEEFRIEVEDLDTGIDDYPSYCDDDKKIHIDCAHNLNFGGYRCLCDNEWADVIFERTILREVGIKTKRFEGMITIYNGNNEVTYQMVSKKDEINGISLAYQKLKGFYKEVLNLGPDFIRVLSMEEWLTCGHISVHELE